MVTATKGTNSTRGMPMMVMEGKGRHHKDILRWFVFGRLLGEEESCTANGNVGVWVLNNFYEHIQ